jgi:hypothetical protein
MFCRSAVLSVFDAVPDFDSDDVELKMRYGTGASNKITFVNLLCLETTHFKTIFEHKGATHPVTEILKIREYRTYERNIILYVIVLANHLRRSLLGCNEWSSLVWTLFLVGHCIPTRSKKKN